MTERSTRFHNYAPNDLLKVGMQPSPHKAASSSERYAVVIGINSYRDANIPPLHYAGNDAVAMRDFLVHPELGKFKKDNVHLLLDSEAALGDIRSQFVYWLGARVQNQDEVWIYFAGRGSTDRTFATATGQPFTNYLIAHDTLHDDLPGSAISLKQLDEWLDLLGDARVIMLFDCGFSAVSRGRALASSKASALDDFAFLPALTQGKRRFLLTGTGPTEISLEDTEIELGLFSRVLLQRLRTAALMPNTASMTWNEFYQTVAAEVAWQAEARGATQKPVKFGVLASEPIFSHVHVLTAPVEVPAPEPVPEPEPVWPRASAVEPAPSAEIPEKTNQVYQKDFHTATAEHAAEERATEAFAPPESVETDAVTREHLEELLRQAKEEARIGSLFRAQDILEKAITLNPNERRAATGLRKIEEAIRRSDRTELVKSAFNSALRYTDEKNYSEAMRYYARVLELDPTSESARLGIESCRELLEKQSSGRSANGRMAPPRPVHQHHSTFNETIWPYIGWVALLGCIWQLFSGSAEGESTAWAFWKTVYWGLVGAVTGLALGSIVYLVKRLIVHLEDRQEKRGALNG